MGLLLKHGANPNIAEGESRIRVYLAVDSGDEGIVKTLLENEADPKMRTDAGIRC